MLVFSVSHEYRHAWQAVNGLWIPEGYFTSNDISVEGYNEQEAEIDANAFAVAYMRWNGIEIRLPSSLGEKIIEKIENQSEILYDQFLDAED